MRILILFIVMSLIVESAKSQSKFYKIFSGSGYDIGKGVAEYPDSSFLITGTTTSWEGSTQVVLLKIDSAGTYQWSNHYGGSESDGANRVLFNSSLGVYSIGYTNSIGEGDYNGLVVHTDEIGNELWQKEYGMNTAWEFFNDAVFGNDTSILMVGESNGVSTGDKDVYLVRINSLGDTLWTKTIQEFGNGKATSVVRIQDSLFLVGGSAYSQDSLSQKGFVMKINMDGDVLWQKTVGNLSGNYSVEDVCIGVNQFYVVGSREFGIDDHDYYAGVFDFDGNVLIEKTEIDNTDIRNHIGDEVCYISNTNKTIIGQRKINQFTFQDDFDVYISYYSPNSLIWQNNFSTINNAGLDRVHQIAETNDGGFIAVGQTTYPLSGGSNIFIFKTGPDGVFPVTAEYYTIDTLVSLSEHSNLQIGIFPNPSKGLFHVQFNQQESKSVLVYSAMGKLIVNEVLFQNGVIDLSTYQDGFYYAKIDQQLFKLIKSSD